MLETNLHDQQKHQKLQTYGFLYFNLRVSTQEMGETGILNGMVANTFDLICKWSFDLSVSLSVSV